MPKVFTAYKRLTNRYINRHSDLDAWDYGKSVTVKLLAPKTIEHANGFDDGGKTRHRAIVKAVEGMDPDDIKQAIRNELKIDGCTHDYDCCGCYFNYVSVDKIGRKAYRVEITHRYNY